MAQNYFELLLEKELIEMIEDTGKIKYLQEPNQSSVDFILNYSKSLSVQFSDKIGPVLLNLN
tara:strand:+ start:241 stop:426 length:186 start_codon:yes stop_codon:yes gene_type:complete